MNPHRVALALIAILCAACVSVAPASAPPGSVTPSAALPSVAATSSPTPEVTSTPTATPTEAPTDAPTDAPSPSPTDDPSEPPTPDPSPAEGSLDETLLTAEDVPETLAPQGVIDGSNFDIDQASFDLFGGEEIVSQVWQGTAGTINAVFDFRLLFPDPASALSYLNGAEAVLSEQVASGLTETPITDPVGENTSYYAGQATVPVTVDFHNFLFTVDRVAVKVFIAGQGATYAEALPIAQAAAERTDAVYGDGTGGALDKLLSHVPTAYADLCVSQATDMEGAIVSVYCEIEGDVDRVQYALFATVESLDAAFLTVATDNEPEEDSGSCSTGPHLGTYTIGGTEAGELVCYEVGTDTGIVWTDREVLIVAAGASGGAGYPELYQWWLDEAGPVR